MSVRSDYESIRVNVNAVPDSVRSDCGQNSQKNYYVLRASRVFAESSYSVAYISRIARHPIFKLIFSFFLGGGRKHSLTICASRQIKTIRSVPSTVYYSPFASCQHRLLLLLLFFFYYSILENIPHLLWCLLICFIYTHIYLYFKSFINYITFW